MIRTIIACGIVPPMSTPSTPTPTPKKTTPSRKPVSLAVVIDELQFLLDLSTESPNDDRLAQLARDARIDFAQAMKKFPGGDDLPEMRDPKPPEN
jgi:hypothetical protein